MDKGLEHLIVLSFLVVAAARPTFSFLLGRTAPCFPQSCLPGHRSPLLPHVVQNRCFDVFPSFLPDSPSHEHFRLFLSGGFGSSKTTDKKKNTKGPPKKMNPREAKRANEQLLQRYGGDINAGTTSRIQSSLDSLDPHLKEAAELYKSVTQFEALIAPMTPSDRNRLIPPVQFQMAEADKTKLTSIMNEHKLSERDLHNIYQRITWDASADAKATRADISGNRLKPELEKRILKACSIAVSATEGDGARGAVLDVGCGHGSIVRLLADAGLSEPDMYFGIDLSPEMIKNAVDRYGAAKNGKTGKGRTFIAGDFLGHDFQNGVDDGGSTEGIFDSVIFCSSLHDLPDVDGSISKAASILRPQGGKLVVVHAQGAMHVLGQHEANPVMVKRGLPTAKEWEEMLKKHGEWGLTLEYGPSDPRSDRDLSEGYLAVLTKL